MRKLMPLVCCFLTSCASGTNVIDNYVFDNTAGIDYVIIPYDPETYHQYIFQNGTPAALTADDLEQINHILQEAVDNYNRDLKPYRESIKALSEYNRQYVPVINAQGEKEVYVNCFRSRYERNFEGWKSNLLMIMDGGSNFFNVTINLTRLTYYNLNVNGRA